MRLTNGHSRVRLQDFWTSSHLQAYRFKYLFLFVFTMKCLTQFHRGKNEEILTCEPSALVWAKLSPQDSSMWNPWHLPLLDYTIPCPAPVGFLVIQWTFGPSTLADASVWEKQYGSESLGLSLRLKIIQTAGEAVIQPWGSGELRGTASTEQPLPGLKDFVTC